MGGGWGVGVGGGGGGGGGVWQPCIIKSTLKRLKVTYSTSK